MTGDVPAEAAAQPGRRRPVIIPDPVIIVLLLIAFFSAISGKPLDGLLMLLVAAGLQLAATRTRAPVPPLGALLSRIMRTRTGRVSVLVAWAWLGLHFFAK